VVAPLQMNGAVVAPIVVAIGVENMNWIGTLAALMAAPVVIAVVFSAAVLNAAVLNAVFAAVVAASGAPVANGVNTPGMVPKTFTVRPKPGAIVPSVTGTATVNAPPVLSGAMICEPKKVPNWAAGDVMKTWFVAMLGVSVTFANAACIWAAIAAWVLDATARLVAVVAPQLRNGAAEAVNIGVHASGAMVCGDSALAVGSGGVGSLEAQLEQIVSAARTLNSLFDTMMRSS
jgi:hypothetical protein